MTKAQQIALALTARLATITLAGGFSLDLGQRVYRGRRQIGENSLPCLVLFEGEDSPISSQGGSVNLTQDYAIEGHAACDPDHPNDIAHQIIGDIKRALFQGDPRLGGLCIKIHYAGRSISQREGGAGFVSAVVRVQVAYIEMLGE